MVLLHIADNLIRLRREKKVTQDEVASFLGVTKASVSKWENSQSMPDILLLPQIAVYFGVTVDELLGFEPQLSKEQIHFQYQELAAAFASRPFDEVLAASKALVHQYYSCYPFLLQICVLWLNHFTLVEAPEQQRLLLQDIEVLCNHILEHCETIEVCNQALSLKALAKLQLGKPGEVIDDLTELVKVNNLSFSNSSLLTQAYLQTGEPEKAKMNVQISLYIHLIALINNAVEYLLVNMEDKKLCDEITQRTEAILTAFELDKLHPNSTAQFYYQSALTCCFHHQEEKALEQLQRFAEVTAFLFSGDNMKLHGDYFFNRLEEWFVQFELGGAPPRNRKLVAEGVLQALDNPAFAALQEKETFQKLKQELQQKMQTNTMR